MKSQQLAESPGSKLRRWGLAIALWGSRAGAPHTVQDLRGAGPVMLRERTRRGSPPFLVIVISFLP